MTRVLLCLLILCLATPAFALDRDQVERVMKDPVGGRKDVVGQALSLSSEDAEVFWPLYEDYLLELASLGDSRRQVKQEYSAVGSAMSDEIAGAMLIQFLELEESEIALRTRYFRKFEEELSAGQAVRLFQVDQQIQLLVRFQAASRLAAQ
jgi:hypothetical protein